jgi:hypothetical protein
MVQGSSYTDVQLKGVNNQAGVIYNRDGSIGWFTGLDNSGNYKYAYMSAMNGTALGNAKDSSTPALYIGTNNKVGVNTGSPSQRFVVYDASGGSDNIVMAASSGGVQAFMQGDQGGGNAVFGALSNSPVVFKANNTEYMRLTTGGVFALNTTTTGGSTPGQQIIYYAQNTNWGMFINNTLNNSGAYAIGFGSGGNLVGRCETTASSTSYVTSSDYRLKEKHCTNDWCFR